MDDPPTRFDPRVLSNWVVRLLRACSEVSQCHLGGGAALSGAYLGHRKTGDVDLFLHDHDEMRELVRQLPTLASVLGLGLTIQRDTGHLVRAQLGKGDETVVLDIVHDPIPDLEPARLTDGVAVESLADLRANKLTCLLSRSEPRDLVDLLFLERVGYRVEDDLPLALNKDSGVDPGVLAWLLSQFPLEPLPLMLKDLTDDELRAFRDDLAERMRNLAVHGGRPSQQT